MQIVIDIEDSVYHQIKQHGEVSEFHKLILNGTPLPKGHGDLVDYKEMKNNAKEYGAYTEVTLSHIKPKIIIEADKSESGE